MPARPKFRKWRARTPLDRLLVVRRELDTMQRGVPISILFATAQLRRDLEAWIRDMRRRVDRIVKTLERDKARKAARRKRTTPDAA